MKKVLFICENDSKNQSTRHRVLDIIDFLRIEDYRLYCGRLVTIGKSKVMLLSVGDLLRIIRDVRRSDLLFIQRTSTVCIYLICLYAKLMNKEIVFDVDDAIFAKRIWIAKNPLYAFFDAIVKASDRVLAGSRCIEEYAKRLNANTIFVPTAVNMKIFDAPAEGAGGIDPKEEFVIGWLGAGEIHLESLMVIKEPLRALARKHRIAFRMVSSLGSRRIREAFRDLTGLKIDYGRDDWMPLEEIPGAMRGVDVSVMPLVDGPFTRGKCSLKVLESMAMRIPVVASGVGENALLIRHGENGYLANSADDWIRCIEDLIGDPAKRRRMANGGYETVARHYAIPVVAERIAGAIGLREAGAA